MSMYEKLDAMVLDRLRNVGPMKFGPLYCVAVARECGRIAGETGREDFRVLDMRLQALRKKGLIRHDTKDGWSIVEGAKA